MRHPFRRTPKGSNPGSGGTGRTDGVGRGGWRDRKNPDGTKPQGAAGTKGDTKTDPEQKHRWRPWRRKGGQESTSTHGAEGNAATGSKPEKKRGRKRGEEKQHNRVYGADPDSASQHKEAARTRKETERTLKELGPIDDHGFQLFDASKVKPSGKLAPRKAVDPDPIETDDMGFPVYIPAKVTPINKNKENTVAVNTSQYTSMVDNSTPQTMVKTLTQAASTARVDAGRKDEEASDFRRSAANLAGMKGMEVEAENLLREAAAAEEDAQARLGMAAGFENQAGKVTA